MQKFKIELNPNDTQKLINILHKVSLVRSEWDFVLEIENQIQAQNKYFDNQNKKENTDEKKTK